MKRKFRVSYEIEIDPKVQGCFKNKELSAYERAVLTTEVSIDVSKEYMKGVKPKYLPIVTEIDTESDKSYVCKELDLLYELNMIEQTLDGMDCTAFCSRENDMLCQRCTAMLELKELSEKIKNRSPLCSGD